MKKIYKVIIFLIIFFLLFFVARKQVFSPTKSDVDEGVTMEILTDSGTKKDIEVIATNLDIPWEIVFLPSGDMLVTERSGKLKKIGSETKVISETSGVKHVGEGGLLGMALHPNFSINNYIYLYFTTESRGGLINRVERYKLSSDTLTDKKVIINNIPGANFHDGGRIKFGPDNYLYITTGDAGDKNKAQDKNSLNGKILRIDGDGNIPNDNPFGNEVYSYGHRNPQGLAWDKNGDLWITEHGPSGLGTGFDEVNKIGMGGNYGWPDIQGDETKEGMTIPIIQSGKSDTWAPAGGVFVGDSLFFAGLRGESLYEYNTKTKKLSSHFRGEWGRLRAVVLGPDNFLYVSTSNMDGRRTINEGDDKVIKINPLVFSNI